MPTASPRRRSGEGAALLAVCLGTAVTALDGTVLNVALPHIRADLGGGTTGSEWVINAYLLMFASLLLTASSIGSRVGQRRNFLAGMLVFGIASPLCSLAPSLGYLVAFRFVQGIGAALIVPAALSLVTHTFPDPRARSKALGLVSGTAWVMVAAGPTFGGFLVDTLGWPSIFWLNVPLVVTCIVLTRRHVVETPMARGRSLDLAGQTLGMVALGTLTAGLIQSQHWGWHSPSVDALLAAGVVGGAVFVVVERRHPEPMVPVRLFTEPAIAAANAIALLLSMTTYGLVLTFSLWLQDVRHWSAFKTGLSLLPLATMGAVMSVASGHLAARFGPKLPIVAGATLGAVTAAGLALVSSRTPYLFLALGFALYGAGLALVTPATSATAMGAGGVADIGMVSGVLNASRQVGNVLGVVLAGALLSAHGHRPNAGMAVCALIFVSVGLVGLVWVPRTLGDPTATLERFHATLELG